MFKFKVFFFGGIWETVRNFDGPEIVKIWIRDLCCVLIGWLALCKVSCNYSGHLPLWAYNSDFRSYQNFISWEEKVQSKLNWDTWLYTVIMVVINLMVYINPVITKRMFPINDYAIILKIVQFCSFLQMKLIYIDVLRIVLRMVYSVCFWHHTVQIGKLVSL